ncbi:MAG TPA: hypothetical protein VFO77_07170, partial [Actinoplanes sp.]|nr:hypothetical protein [Actinoplanes sp.]
AVVGAVVVVAAGVTMAVNIIGDTRADTRILAMAQSELTPSLHDAARDCLAFNAAAKADAEGEARGHFAGPMATTDLAVAAERGDETAVLLMNDREYLACERSAPDGREPTGGMSSGRWKNRDWVPGPVQRLSMTSTEMQGGDVTVIGRVSSRVHRLVLDHGDGHQTPARLKRGVFGLISDGHRVRQDAALVTYDADGKEIGREPLFRPLEEGEDGRCYVNPAGDVVFGKKGTGCLRAEPWSRYLDTTRQ